MVGGSTAFGTGLGNDEHTFAFQLQQLLPNSEVINAAVIGHHSGQELVHVVVDVINFSPDLIVSLDGWNDFHQFGYPKPEYGLGFGGFSQVENQLLLSYRITDPNFFRRMSQGVYTLMFP